ncbi:MAG: alginate O-acetyltransferase complex protein AlgI [Rhodospirillaceae bacterium]|jgi:alginate O-acetyltransferase complex protein AlgI|nr:alginate O-acetyltransferase complex protein AlgI [Rhodospirillaceae bacterium]
MLFSSIAFLFYFLPLFLLAYFLLPARNAVFLVFSLAFYALGEGPYLLLLLASIGANYRFALLIEHEATQRGRRSRRWITFAIAFNLALLGLFKYGNFLLAQLAVLGVSAIPALPVHLPLGISFFTFHAISYLVDVHRGDARAERNLATLALYVAMFPQLIAGPIIRFKTIVGELHERRATVADAAAGIRLFAIGLAQKTLIANTLALPADRIFALPGEMLTAPVAWLGAIAYGLQLYFDFCGYSLMALGLARAFGLHFPRNFNYPYVSRSLTEFWHRWHITLSQWFRDYVYIPLGGNRRGPVVTYRNLLIVFVLCGLWHGAAWTFVIWGLYHGLFLTLERLGLARILARAWPPLAHIYALLAIFAGWVLFRAEDLGQATAYFTAMAGLNRPVNAGFSLGWFLTPDVRLALAAGILGATPFAPWMMTKLRELGETVVAPRLAVVAGEVALPLGLLLLSAMTLAIGSYNPFIYFRF